MSEQKKTNLNTFKRYQALLVSITVFLAMILVLLVFSFYSSKTVQDNTAVLKVATHVSTDLQSIVKDIFDMEISYGEAPTSPHMQAVLARLEYLNNKIEANLVSLEHGGKAIDRITGESLNVPKITDAEMVDNINRAREEWNKLKPLITKYLAGAQDITVDSAIPLGQASAQAKLSSVLLDPVLNELNSYAYAESYQQYVTIRLLQTVGVLSIFVYFGVFVLFVMRRLRAADAETMAAQQETAEIMANVNSGLFLLDKQLNIGSQYSRAFADLIGTNDIAGRNLTRVLKNKVSQKDLKVTEGFIDQLYNERVKERLVDDLNPLKKVLVQSDDTHAARYLDFKFSRVYEDKQISRILVNVQDVTQEVRLEERLEKQRQENDLQVEMLLTILNASPALIKDFIVNTQNNITRVNNVLKSPGATKADLDNKLANMYRLMHSLKGEASALGLHSFTAIAANFEDGLKGLQNKHDLTGKDFLSLTILLDELLNLTNTIEQLSSRINSTPTGAPEKIKQDDLVSFYKNFVKDIADRQHKKVNLLLTGAEDINIDPQKERMIREIVIQLIRNCIAHGIEAPQVREQKGKTEIGNIALGFEQDSSAIKITVSDDGAGIDYDTIRARAIAKHGQEAAEWNTARLNRVIFERGFSTKDASDIDAGEGVGMDIIATHIRTLDGSLSIDSIKDEHTTFVITIPSKA